MDLHLSGKLALVTGSTAWIGSRLAQRLPMRVRLCLSTVTQKTAWPPVIAKIRQKRSYAKLEPLVGDLGLAEAVEQTTSRFPNVDILVNNLGHYEVKAFEDIPDEAWMAIIETNSMSGVRLSRHYLPKMKARNGFFARESMGRPIDK